MFILSGLFLVFSPGSTTSLTPVLLRLMGYLMLCVCGCSKQKHLKINGFEYLIYGLLIFLNTYVVRAVITFIEPFIVVKYMVTVYFVFGFILILLGAFAVRYCLVNDSRSKYFAFLVLFLTSSEIINVITIYLDLGFLRYFEYFFFLLGLSFGVLFSVVENRNDKVFKLIKSRRG
jgi:hypothetical protein